MSYYLIDYENKKTLQGISTLTESDHVIFFYSNNSNTLNFSLHREIVNSPASFDYYEVAVGGKNALDFQLSSYIGYLISERPDESFFIVSSDKGFDDVIDFWKKVGEAPAKIERVNNIIEEKPEGKTATAVPQGLCA